ncbi:MAG: hypothetical protein FWF41_04330 [Betaproteobacteria bacterium]|nr:hypothetical protein [Betaproteobacteria bacterium]
MFLIADSDTWNGNYSSQFPNITKAFTNAAMDANGACSMKAITIRGSTAFSPAIAGGTQPSLSVSCTPTATSTGSNTWQILMSGGGGTASCTLTRTGGVAPPGYSLGTTTTYSSTSGTMNATTGAFTVPFSATIFDVAATVPITLNPIVTASNNSGTVAFSPAITGGTVPTMTLNCTPAATSTGVNSWNVNVGAACTLGLTGGAAPPGYAMSTVTYGPSGTVNASTGAFTVPSGGITTLSATVALVTNPLVTVSGAVTGGVAFSPAITGGTLPTLTLSCASSITPTSTGTNAWTVPQGSSCTLGRTGGVAPPGYTIGATTIYAPTPTVNASTGAFTVPAGGITTLLATAPLTTNAPAPISGTVAFSPAITGGTAPTLTLSCASSITPTANGTNAWNVPQGASCTLGRTGGTPPPGYSFGAVTYGPSGTINTSTGVFIVPAGGLTDLTATVALTTNASVPVSGTVAFDPAITGGTFPTLTLACASSITPTSTATNAWTVPQGSSCTLGTTGGIAPPGYTIGTPVTYAPTATVNASTGVFTVPAGGITTLLATVPLTTNATVPVSGSVAFDPAITGGTLPTLTLACASSITPTANGTNAWNVPQGASCTLGRTGGTPPPGYSLAGVTYGPAGSINASSGAFAVPTGGITDLTATVEITLNTSVEVSASIAWAAGTTAGGTLPALTLTCIPMATPDGANTWSVAGGAACTLGTTGGTPPPGYSLDTVTYGPSGSIQALSGDFTVPMAGINTLTATVSTRNNPTATVSAAIAWEGATDPAVAVTGTLPELTLNCVPMAASTGTNSWTVAEGAHCTLGTESGFPPYGYSFDEVTYGPHGSINATSGDFTVPVGGITTLTAAVSIIGNPSATVSGTIAFDPAIPTAVAMTGAVPHLTLTCTPMATLDSPNHWTVAEGASCTMGTTGGMPPYGYSFDTVTYGPTGSIQPVSGSFTVPVGGITTLTANVTIDNNPNTTVQAGIAWDPSISSAVAATGTLPNLTLNCVPMATQNVPGNWTVAEGASCTLGTTGGFPPYGYSFGAVTYGPTGSIQASSGDFTVPVGGVTLTASMAITNNPTSDVQASIAWDSSIPSAVAATGALPSLTLNCTPMATQDSPGNWTAAEGSSCTLGTTGGMPPYGYSFSTITYGVSGSPSGSINAASGDFTVPAGGITDLTVTVAISNNPNTTVQASIDWDSSIPPVVAATGTLPHVTLSCVPMATQNGEGNWTAAEGASCALGVSGGFPPYGYSFDTVIYGGGANATTGAFTVPVGGITTLTETMTITNNADVTVQAAIEWDSSIPSAVAATGALPNLTLICVPVAAQDALGSWTVAEGANCTLGTTGGTPPYGYSFAGVTYASTSGGAIQAVSGHFTAPEGGIDLTATVAISNNPNTTVQASIAWDSSIASAVAATGALPTLTLNCVPMASQNAPGSWTVAEGASCTLGTTGGAPPYGYSFEEVTYGPTGSIQALSGDFTVPVGGVTLTATMAIVNNPNTAVHATVAWDSSIASAVSATGTLPRLTLTCVPMATEDSPGNWLVAEGASCTLGTTGGSPPYGYSFDEVTYGPTGSIQTSSGDFTVPVGGTTLTATMAITHNPAVTVTGTMAWDPAIASAVAMTGALPHLTLACVPMATQNTEGNWTVAEGAVCTMGTTGGMPPYGYSFDEITYGPAGSINTATGDFTVPVGGIGLTATVTITGNPSAAVHATIAWDSAIPSAVSATGALPHLTLNCVPMATQDSPGNWTVAEGASCTLGTSGGMPPYGYSFSTVTYSPNGTINATSGAFIVPVGGASTLAATVAITNNPSATVSAAIAWNSSISPAVAATGTLPHVTLSCVPMATQNSEANWTVAEGASCTLGISGGFPPYGYSFAGVTYGGGADPTAGTFIVPVGGITTLTETMAITDNPVVTVSGTVAFSPAIPGGTVPHLTLDCVPMATPTTTNNWTVAEGASCTLGTTGGTPPPGYSLGAVTYGGGADPTTGAFTVPVSGINTLTATVALTLNDVVPVSGTVAFNPAITGGTAPTLTLSCDSSITPTATGTNAWTVNEGASCTLGTTGGTPPPGYSLGAVTYGGGATPTTGAFIVPVGGINTLTATVALTTNAAVPVSGTVAFNPAITGGTLPTLTLSCDSSITPTANGTNAWTVNEGASCTLGTTGGTPPPGYSLGTVTYGGGADPAAGTFIVPVGGMTTLTATVALNLNDLVNVTGAVGWDSSIPSAVAATGTLPSPTLACTPDATATGAGAWTVHEGASCTLGTAGGAPPYGYSFAGVTYTSTSGGAIQAVSGHFTAPTGGIDLTATVAISNNPNTNVQASIAWNSSIAPAVSATGTLPSLTLNCVPMAAQNAPGSWTVAEGASCTLGTTGGSPPYGYSFDVVTYGPSGSIQALSGDFTVPAGGVTLTATMSIVNNPNTTVQATIVFDPSIPSATAATGTLPSLTLNCVPMAAQNAPGSWTVAEGASCTLGTTGGSPPYGFSFDAVTYGPSGSIQALSGDFTVPVGGTALTATMAITNNPSITVTGLIAFDATVPTATAMTGTLPHLTLNCTPMATQNAEGNWTVAEGAVCTMGTTGGMPPYGYSFAAVTYGPSGSIQPVSGDFTAPPGDIDFDATVTITGNPSAAVHATIAWDSAIASAVAATGALPHLTLNCVPMATQDSPGNWTVAEGASCTLGTSGGMPPYGYSFSAVTYSPNGTINATSGAFVVPVGGISTLAATVTITGNPAATVSAAIAWDSSVPLAVAATGSLPRLTLNCVPMATQNAEGNWTVAEGASCTLGTSGGMPPYGYSFEEVTYGPTGSIQTLSGDFTVPVGGIDGLTATVTISNNPSAPVQGTVVFDSSIPAAVAATGATPHLALSCIPIEMQTAVNQWIVAEGASCNLTTAGGMPPLGYSFDTVTYSSSSGSIQAASGNFIVPVGGMTDIVATVTIKNNPAATVHATIAWDSSVAPAVSATGALPHLTLTCTPMATQDSPNDWTVAEGAACSLGTTGGMPPPGYSFNAVAYASTPAGQIQALSGDFTVPVGGAALTATVTVSNNPSTTLRGTVSFDPSIDPAVAATGMPPNLTLMCTPIETRTAVNNWIVAEGASCNLTTAGGMPPPGYSFDTVFFGPAGVIGATSGDFTVPVGGGNLTAIVTIRNNPAVGVSATIAWDSGIAPAVAATGALPHLTLTCTPMATQNAEGNWTVASGANCTLGTSGGMPPPGHSFSVVSYSGGAIDPTTGVFTVPSGGANLAATITISNNPAVTVSGAVVFDASVAPAIAAGGTLPHLTLTCVPMAAQNAEGNWTVASSASCTLGTSGGMPPPGYSFGAVSYSGGTIDPTTGAFVVPSAGISSLVAAVTLDLNPPVGVSGMTTFVPAVAGGILPTLTLTCDPAATAIRTNAWSANAGASCVLGTIGGMPPPGYSFDVVTFGPSLTVDPMDGTFTVPAGGISNLMAAMALNLNDFIFASGTASLDLSVDPALAARSTLPQLMLTCIPAAAPLGADSWIANEGASCTLSTIGGTPPAGYLFAVMAYGPSGVVDPATGMFYMPAGGITNLSALLTLTRGPAAGSTPIPALDPKALLMLAVAFLLIGSRKIRRNRAR